MVPKEELINWVQKTKRSKIKEVVDNISNLHSAQSEAEKMGVVKVFKICINTTEQELEKEKAQNKILAQRVSELESQIHREIQCEPKKLYG